MYSVMSGLLCVQVVNENEELCAVEEMSATYDMSVETSKRLYGRQQISFTVHHHASSVTAALN